MAPILSPDCDCELIASANGFQGLAVREHHDASEACREWLEMGDRYRRSWREERPPGDRYSCVHLGGQHVIGVRDA